MRAGLTTLAVLAAVAAGLVTAAGAQGAPLRAGSAVADITPANGGTTLGFVRPDITVKGVHTRLTGRVLVLDDGDTQVALLATDLAFPLEKESLVARVKDLGFTHETILYTGTHTHSGPEHLDAWQVEQLARAIRSAHARRVPARAAWGTSRVTDVSRNRSVEAHLANHGQDLFYGQGHPQDDPLGTEHTRDTTLRLLRVERLDGTPLAAWTEFPVHLTTSTPRVDLWDADLAGAAEHHLEHGVAKVGKGHDGFVALWNNGASGDLMPYFDSYNPTATMDLLGRRIAHGARRAWRSAGRRLAGELPVDVRWTRICYCGQEVEQGRRIAATPVFGLPFLGGSEDGASIFHEPVQTEGRRLPAGAADPVHGRKIQALPSAPFDVHETNPEVQVVRVGDRLLLAAPGEPSVEMARRLQEAVGGVLPAGVRDVAVVGLSNDYMGYLTTPEEYEMQHYEGGHTVFGTWTSLLTRDSFVALTRALARGERAPDPSQPGGLGSAAPASPPLGNGGVDGRLVSGPAGEVERMQVVELEWTGAPGGVDRPVDDPFLALERQDGQSWRRVDSDLALAFTWRETDEGRYRARYDVPPSLPAGTHRLRVTSGRYDLTSRAFEVVPSDELVPLGVTAKRLKRRRTRLVLTAQHPAPDPQRAILYRPVSPAGGTAMLRVGGRRVRARWSPSLGGWRAVVRGRVRDGTAVRVAAGDLRDGAGNLNGEPADLRVGRTSLPAWPTTMGVGGGRTPGFGGEGSFPP